MKVFLIIICLTPCIVLTAVLLVRTIKNGLQKIRFRSYCRRLDAMSPSALVEEALHYEALHYIETGREYEEAIVSRISDSDALLRIGRAAASLTVRAAAKGRHCVLFGHRLNEKCVCELCGKEAHDFRDEHGETPKWGVPGAYPCARCHAVYHVEDFPGCKETCAYVECNDGDGEIERYSSQSGQGGSWFEPCPYYEAPGVKTRTTYEEQRAFLAEKAVNKGKK